MFKNIASQKIALFVYDSTTGAPKTGDGANLTPYVSKDYGTVTVLGTTTATELDATNAKGWYSFVLTQGETNADALLFTGKSSTSNIFVVGALIYTDPPNFSSFSVDANGRVDVIKIAGTTQTARDIGASVLLSSGTGTGQLSFTSGILKVDVDTIKTNPVVNGGTVTFPTNATLASTTNITSITGNITGNLSGSVGSVTGAVGSVTGNVGGNVTGSVGSVVAGVTVTTNNDKTGYALTAAYDPAKTAAQAGDAMTLTAGERVATADAFLNRDMSTGTDSGSPTVRTPRQAFRFLRNKWTIAANTLTVFKEDDTATSWTSTTATTASNPVTSSDPAG